MKTFLFPFTTIEAPLAEGLAAALGPVTLLQPSLDTVLPATQHLRERGSIAVVFPAEGSRESLQDLLTSFEQWADLHAGGDRGALREQGRMPPFFDGQSTAQLVAEIRKGALRPDGAPPRSDPALTDAQLFLAMAQKFDHQQAELAREIEALAAKEQQMLALLKGDDEVAEALPGSTWAGTSSGPLAMIDMRLKAWALVIEAAEPALPEHEVLFMTVGKEIVDQISEIFPAMVHHLAFSLPPAGAVPERKSRDLPAWLSDIRGGDPWQAALVAMGEDADFDLFEIPAIPPRAFLQQLSGRRCGPGAARSSKVSPDSTWIGCLTLPGRNRENF